MPRQGSASGVELQLSYRNIAATIARVYAIYPETIAGAKEAVQTSAETIRDRTKATVHVDTHFMQEHCEAWISNEGLTFETGWRESDFDAAGLPFYPIFQEFGTIHMAANPALSTAYAEEKPHFQAEVSRLVREAIERRRTEGGS
jgi:HK97 gp10 family phage protein